MPIPALTCWHPVVCKNNAEFDHSASVDQRVANLQIWSRDLKFLTPLVYFCCASLPKLCVKSECAVVTGLKSLEGYAGCYTDASTCQSTWRGSFITPTRTRATTWRRTVNRMGRQPRWVLKYLLAASTASLCQTHFVDAVRVVCTCSAWKRLQLNEWLSQ